MPGNQSLIRWRFTSTDFARRRPDLQSDPRKIICGEHGASDACLVCMHLQSKGSARGFRAAQHPNPEPEWSHLREARCHACDWWLSLPSPLPRLYSRFVGAPHLVCVRCFEQIEASNRKLGDQSGWWSSSQSN